MQHRGDIVVVKELFFHWRCSLSWTESLRWFVLPFPDLCSGNALWAQIRRHVSLDSTPALLRAGCCSGISELRQLAGVRTDEKCARGRNCTQSIFPLLEIVCSILASTLSSAKGTPPSSSAAMTSSASEAPVPCIVELLAILTRLIYYSELLYRSISKLWPMEKGDADGTSRKETCGNPLCGMELCTAYFQLEQLALCIRCGLLFNRNKLPNVRRKGGISGREKEEAAASDPYDQPLTEPYFKELHPSEDSGGDVEDAKVELISDAPMRLRKVDAQRHARLRSLYESALLWARTRLLPAQLAVMRSEFVLIKRDVKQQVADLLEDSTVSELGSGRGQG